MICVDANILIAALSSSDAFHDAAAAALIDHDGAIALNVTWAEALVHPHRLGKADEAREVLTEFGVRTHDVTDDIAVAATALRATHGNRNFPMLDALVVAAGSVLDLPILTTDSKWPDVDGVDIRLLTA